MTSYDLGERQSGYSNRNFEELFKAISNNFEMMNLKYAIVIEESKTGFGAYVPDLPGCVAVARTKTEVIRLLREGIEFYLEGMKLNSYKIPDSQAETMEIEVRVA